MNKFEILNKISLVQRDNGDHFTVNDKLSAIREILSDSPFHEAYAGSLTSVWTCLTEEELKVLPMPVMLTSHIDNVKDIRHPFTAMERDRKYGNVLHGTFDNMITNAALIDIMVNQSPESNILFCFDGDEETGQCRGLTEAVKFVHDTCENEIGFVIATDVTEEGFSEKKDYTKFKDFSLENMSGSKEFQEAFARSLLSGNEHRHDFCFVPHPSEVLKMPEELKDFYDGSTGWCDEAFTIRDLNLNGASICLPIKGPMHSDKGCITRPEIYSRYCTKLGTLMNKAAVLDKEICLIKAPKYEPENTWSYYTAGSYVVDDDYYDLGYHFDDPDNISKDYVKAIKDFDDEMDLMTRTFEFLVENANMSEETAEETVNNWYSDFCSGDLEDQGYSFADYFKESMEDLVDLQKDPDFYYPDEEETREKDVSEDEEIYFHQMNMEDYEDDDYDHAGL